MLRYLGLFETAHVSKSFGEKGTPIGTTLTILPVFGLLCVSPFSNGGFADLGDCLTFLAFFSIKL